MTRRTIARASRLNHHGVTIGFGRIRSQVFKSKDMINPQRDRAGALAARISNERNQEARHPGCG